MRMHIGLGIVLGLAAASFVGLQACSSDSSSNAGFNDAGDDGTGAEAGVDAGDDGEGGSTDDGPGDGCTSVFGCNDAPVQTGQHIPATCAEALKNNSYFGCDYYPTVTLNPVWEQFDFAVAVSNPQQNPVNVTVNGGALGGNPVNVQIPAQSVQAIPLPWVPELKGPAFDQNTAVRDPGSSRIVPQAAYHLTTDFPVSVYQFSALEYEIDAGTTSPDGGACPGYNLNADAGPVNAHCYSYSNDASLLLPSNVASTSYGILAWPAFAATPGFLAVVATKDNTNVTVNPGGRVQGVPNVGPPVMVRGDSYTYQLNTGDVLEMFSDTGDVHKPLYTSDISGTIVTADQPIVTYAGHGCTWIPENKKACDHLESSMFPVDSLGAGYIATMPHTPHGEHEWVRIMAFYDNTKVAFDPPVSGYNGWILNQGDILELPDVDQPFAIVADGRIAVTHYELGEFATVPDDAGVPNPDLGDPSECPAIPVAQYRSSYTFLAPSTYAENWIDVVSPTGATITLDGNNLDPANCNQVGGQPFCVWHVQLDSTNGDGHSISGNAQFGLYVYGYGSRTSYMYPGGLDLEKLTIQIPK